MQRTAVASEWTILVDEPDNPVQNVVIKGGRTRIDGDRLKSSVDALAPVVEATARALDALGMKSGGAGDQKSDCIVIETDNGTVIRINCPVITAGKPTIE